MALATQCPHCQTTFRVVQDQLKLRAGLVRCGNCKEIFNGIENLLRPDGTSRAAAAASSSKGEIAPRAESAAKDVAVLISPAPVADLLRPESTKIAAPVEAPIRAPIQALPSAEPASDITDFFDLIKKPVTDVVEPTVAKATVTEVVRDKDPLNPVTLIAFPDDLLPSEVPDNPASQVRSETTMPAEATAENSYEDNSAEVQDPLDAAVESLHRMPTAEVEEPSFVTFERRRQRNARILRQLTRVGSILLLVSLILQGVYLFRNQIAAYLPQMKPALVQACSALGCSVGLPMQLDAITIESDGPHPLAANKDGYEFTALLRNYSQTEQAWPHVELILKGADGKTVVRRVFAPAEYLASREDLAKGISPKSEHAAKLFFELSQLNVARYEVDRFYP